ncbi:MAG: N-acetylglucosaminyltransferase [Snowella sp.]|nr:N-acetylglucosaminyltransferase [Snowella sp.]
MRVCYFIQAHNYPDQIYQLVKTIKRGSPNSVVIIGYDCTHSSIEMEPIQHLSDVYLLTGNFPIRRGEFSILRPYLNAVDWLLEKEIEFDWLAYLSGQDYPIKPLEEIENYLAKAEYDGFLQYYNVLSEQSHWSIEEGKTRYFTQYYWTLPISKNPLLEKVICRAKYLIEKLKSRFHQFGLPTLLPSKVLFTYANTIRLGLIAKKSPFNNNFTCYGGNHRHFLSRKCLVYLKDYINHHQDLVKYYEKTELPEESFVQTVLVNSGLFNFYNHHQIYDDYKMGSVNGHPKTLTLEDYPKLIQSDCFFARKFEANSSVLDLLDEHFLVPVNS